MHYAFPARLENARILAEPTSGRERSFPVACISGNPHAELERHVP